MYHNFLIHSFADGHVGCFQYLAIGYVMLGTLGVGVAIREMQIKTTMSKWDLIKIKSFCVAKENGTKLQRERTVWENMFANDETHKLEIQAFKQKREFHKTSIHKPSLLCKIPY